MHWVLSRPARWLCCTLTLCQSHRKVNQPAVGGTTPIQPENLPKHAKNNKCNSSVSGSTLLDSAFIDAFFHGKPGKAVELCSGFKLFGHQGGRTLRFPHYSEAKALTKAQVRLNQKHRKAT
eukprot:s99_g5.t2